MKKSKHEEVELPITPMLDMAFQLLTFFILTYHPAPTEGQFAMNLLPAAPVADSKNLEAPPPDAVPDPSIPAALKTLTTRLQADSSGNLGKVSIGEIEVNGMDELSQKLGQMLNDPTLPFDQALIQADPLLKYADLMKVIDVFSRNKVTKISFSELEANAAGAAL